MAAIWLEGNIGVGKTTLGAYLASALNLRLLEEKFRNPLFEKYAKDPKKYAFAFQMWMLPTRYVMHQLGKYEAWGYTNYDGVIFDRGLPGDRVIAKVQHEIGNIEDELFDVYDMNYNLFANQITSPTALVMLDAEPEVCQERIVRRNRNEERGIELDYLQRIRKGYWDMFAEVEAHIHPWSSGMMTKRIPYNVDHQDPWPIVEEIAHMCKLNITKAKDQVAQEVCGA